MIKGSVDSASLSQWRYKEKYQRTKDKYTIVLETPEHDMHQRSKKISDVSAASPQMCQLQETNNRDLCIFNENSRNSMTPI